MQAASWVVACLWAAFALCWLVLARFIKKASRAPWRTAWGLRLVLLAWVLAVIAYRRRGMASLFAFIGRAQPPHAGSAGQWAGVGLCLVGFGFALWARIHMGRNWGMPMSLRQDHELVTCGPYAYVRHPIYTGIMLAMLGSALATRPLWLALFPLYLVFFIFSARVEEKMLLAQFPNAYPAYRRRTKMLIPFVL